MRPLVIVRPEPGASATAQAAKELGLRAVAVPLFAIERVDWEPPDPRGFDAVLLTSANAVRFAGDKLRKFADLPTYCVGEATAAAARAAGLRVAGTGCGGVDELLQSVSPRVRLLHLCGADRRVPGDSAHPILAIPVYRSIEADAGTALDIAESAVVAIHSPRAAAAFARQLDARGLARHTVGIAAISKAAAEAAGAGWERVRWPDSPTDSALLSLAAELCDKPH